MTYTDLSALLPNLNRTLTEGSRSTQVGHRFFVGILRNIWILMRVTLRLLDSNAKLRNMLNSRNYAGLLAVTRAQEKKEAGRQSGGLRSHPPSAFALESYILTRPPQERRGAARGAGFRWAFPALALVEIFDIEPYFVFSAK